MSGSGERVIGSDAARAVGRFQASGPDGYRAATMPHAPLRKTRIEAEDDELAWLTRPPAAASCGSPDTKEER